MKTAAKKVLLSVAALPLATTTGSSNGQVSYIIGGIVALLLLGYLIYSLLRPDKF